MTSLHWDHFLSTHSTPSILYSKFISSPPSPQFCSSPPPSQGREPSSKMEFLELPQCKKQKLEFEPSLSNNKAPAVSTRRQSQSEEIMIYSTLQRGIKCHPLWGKAHKAVFSVSTCDSKIHFPEGFPGAWSEAGTESTPWVSQRQRTPRRGLVLSLD